MNCSVCNKEIPEGKKFCPYCGTPVSQPHFCNKCGAPLAPNAKFCKVCGNRIMQNGPITYQINDSEPPIIRQQSQSVFPQGGAQPMGDGIPTQTTHEYDNINAVEPDSTGIGSNEEYLEYDAKTKGAGSKIWIFILIAVLLIGGGIFAYWKFNVKAPAENTNNELDSTEIIAEEVSQSDNNESERKAFESIQSSSDNDGYARIPQEWPSILGDLTSSDAYTAYADDVNDMSMGDNWRSSSFISNAIYQGGVMSNLKASGNINGSSVKFEAAIMKDGRIYGRYKHSNGTKLDVNGIIDKDGNLVIKLGHGSATSYWVLHKSFSEGNGQIVNYTGTWGKHDLHSDLRCVYSGPEDIQDVAQHKTVRGVVIANNGKEYPFSLSFDQNNNDLSNAFYDNSNYGTKVKLQTAKLREGEYYFSGKLGKDLLTIRFSDSAPYDGTMTSGNNTSSIRMYL